MSGSFEKSVKGGTKIKLAAPKAKYVEHILIATHAGEAGVAEIFRALQNRLRDSTWTIVFKSLIIAHLMIREGEPNVTLKYLADSPSKLAISNFSDAQAQGTNVRHYHGYVLSRAKAFRDTKVDWVREGQARLKKQTVSKGLLRETKTVQMQINALLKCDFLSNEPENEITLTAFRLLTMDLLILFGIMNEGTINVLEHYFEMSKYDAEQALEIYKTFSRQTDRVVQFLSVARQYENSTRLEIPKLKHAPTSLTSSLEEYLNDPDFEVNRRQYLAQQDAKKGKGSAAGSSSKPAPKAQNNTSAKGLPEPKNIAAAPGATASRPEPKGPAPDLIDFFDSIEDKQQPMATQPGQLQGFQNNPQFQQQQQPSTFSSSINPFLPNGAPQQQQMTGFAPQSNPYGSVQNQINQPMQPDFSGTGFGDNIQQPYGQLSQFGSLPPSNSQPAFAPQQQPLQQFSTGQQSFDHNPQSPQSTNPFRQVSMPTGTSTSTFSNSPSVSSPLSQRGTNPFARNGPSNLPNQSQAPSFGSIPQQQQQTPQPFAQQQSQSPFQHQPQQPFLPPQTSQPYQQQQAQSPPPATQPLQPHRTGTNPFARNITPASSQNPTPPPPMMPNMTGSTNPFRQSTFVNQQTGQGWQANQGSMGGLEQLNTVPVFPRPGQQPPQPWP
ncbi:MAG: hypothetical protein LQ350_001839 [Teloschistes chrysophthalmus]|nr:MAG: hypothetical protein LQ350_001839 [Niorma chrysophthalma]